MEGYKRNASGLFLIELMLVVLFTLIALGACVRMFSYAAQTSRQSRALTHATVVAQNTIALLKDDKGETDLLFSYYPAQAKNGEETVFFDANFSPAEQEENAVYTMHLYREKRDGLIYATLVFSQKSKEEPLYMLKAGIYSGKEDAL